MVINGVNSYLNNFTALNFGAKSNEFEKWKRTTRDVIVIKKTVKMVTKDGHTVKACIVKARFLRPSVGPKLGLGQTITFRRDQEENSPITDLGRKFRIDLVLKPGNKKWGFFGSRPISS